MWEQLPKRWKKEWIRQQLQKKEKISNSGFWNLVAY